MKKHGKFLTASSENPFQSTMKPTRTITQLAVTAATAVIAATLAVTSTHAAVINLTDQSLTPDGTNTILTDYVNINTLNDNSNVLASAPSTAYFVTTFTWGTGSNAHMKAHFNLDAPGDANNRGRVGVEVNDDGLVSTFNTGDGTLTIGEDTFPKRTTLNLAQDLAGQSITLLVKLNFDANNSATYGSTNTAEDLLMNIWVNPTGASVEGSGLDAGDLYVLWNASSFKGFKQIIENQSTPGTATSSTITNTTILTGANATWDNALALAIPEPSAALLGGLGLLALLRRRRIA